MKTPFTTQQEHGLFTLKETSIVLPKFHKNMHIFIISYFVIQKLNYMINYGKHGFHMG